MARNWYKEEHEIFRNAFRKHLEREVIPYFEEWEEKGEIPREAWKKMGQQGYLCPWLEEKYGGSGVGFEYPVIINEEMARAGVGSFLVGLHADIIAPYIHSFGSEEQKLRWLPECATGDTLLSVAMTEPDAGSDLQAIRTTAVKDGDHYIINGQKIFISNGMSCDLVIVAAKTNPQAVPPYKGISLILVENGTQGFIKVKKLNKMGGHTQDTAELLFEDCRVPAANLLGEEGAGFIYLMKELQQERLVAAIWAQAEADSMLQMGIDYARQRKVFGKPVSRFQHNSFKIVEMATEVELGRAFMDELIQDYLDGKDIVKKVSMAKWWLTEMANRVAYDSLQLHGGFGYMEEYPICRAYRDIRHTTIYGGSTEIMKHIIARMMKL